MCRILNILNNIHDLYACTILASSVLCLITYPTKHGFFLQCTYITTESVYLINYMYNNDIYNIIILY